MAAALLGDLLSSAPAGRCAELLDGSIMSQELVRPEGRHGSGRLKLLRALHNVHSLGDSACDYAKWLLKSVDKMDRSLSVHLGRTHTHINDFLLALMGAELPKGRNAGRSTTTTTTTTLGSSLSKQQQLDGSQSSAPAASDLAGETGALPMATDKSLPSFLPSGMIHNIERLAQ
eukprot:UC1_evm1s1121